jgi:hypothetical protein
LSAFKIPKFIRLFSSYAPTVTRKLSVSLCVFRAPLPCVEKFCLLVTTHLFPGLLPRRTLPTFLDICSTCPNQKAVGVAGAPTTKAQENVLSEQHARVSSFHFKAPQTI